MAILHVRSRWMFLIERFSEYLLKCFKLSTPLDLLKEQHTPHPQTHSKKGCNWKRLCSDCCYCNVPLFKVQGFSKPLQQP